MARKRWDVLSKLIKQHNVKILVEVGMKSGRNMDRILNQCPDLIAHGVDCWVPTENYKRWPDSSHAKNEREADQVVAKYPSRLTKHKGFSVPVSEAFEDESVDMVFIDADHSYEGVRADIDSWMPKVKTGGVISGHDYDNTVKYGDLFKGVDKAVKETFGFSFILEDDHVWWTIKR